ncbi:uncharacterized protein LOC118564162 [Fundulus heteroclitus]|uniref:uncharacterized protein LOC118564162 n=1 Tax=Fundulus heteroclitus TaxID=8078 RepID=UPI00165C51D6|nr:uncharacterized protein LOC118564162 [Fundulus heteroclitus]
MSFTARFRAKVRKAVRKIFTCCCAEDDSDNDSNDFITEEETGTKDEKFIHGTYQDPFQSKMATEEEPSACFEVEIIDDVDHFFAEDDSRSESNPLTVQTSENFFFAANVPETKMTGTEIGQGDTGKKENAINPDLLSNDFITEEESGTKDEKFIHGTYQDPFQDKMATEEEPRTHPAPQTDENITQNDPSPPFQAKEINKERAGNIIISEVLNQTECCYQGENSQTNQDPDPTMFFCKFPNSFQNSWLNASMQSILHLSVARKVVAQHPEKIFKGLSASPLCAKLLCSAMQHPGKHFTLREIYQVVMEILANVPSLDLTEENHPLYFLDFILARLHCSGIKALFKEYTALICEQCQTVCYEESSAGPILGPLEPEPYDSTTSLLNRMVADFDHEHCMDCNSIFKQKRFIHDNNVIVLCRELTTSEMGLNCPVIPSNTIDIPVKDGTQLYRLSSVICSQSLHLGFSHFYTYLMCGQMTYKVEDTEVTASNRDCVADICHNGFIYIYEKYTEGDDEFSAWIKATPEQEHESTARRRRQSSQI